MTLTKRSLKMLGKNANYFSDPHFQDIIERRQTKRSQQSFICYLTFELTESKCIEDTIHNALFLVIIATKVIISFFYISFLYYLFRFLNKKE